MSHVTEAGSPQPTPNNVFVGLTLLEGTFLLGQHLIFGPHSSSQVET